MDKLLFGVAGPIASAANQLVSYYEIMKMSPVQLNSVCVHVREECRFYLSEFKYNVFSKRQVFNCRVSKKKHSSAGWNNINSDWRTDKQVATSSAESSAVCYVMCGTCADDKWVLHLHAGLLTGRHW